MTKLALTPLKYPSTWARLNRPPRFTSRQIAWQQTALVGNLIKRWHRLRRNWQHRDDVLLPIERSIVEQLRLRPKFAEYSSDLHINQITAMLSKAIGEEKLIDPPALHPDDPCPLLFFGSFDDWTGILFSHSLQARFGEAWPIEQAEKCWKEQWTLNQLILAYLKVIPTEKSLQRIG
jgi:hypothetical protein